MAKSEATSTAVEAKPVAGVATVVDEGVAAFLAAATNESDRDPLEVQLSMVSAILNATDIADVFSTQHDAQHMRDWIGIPFLCTGVKFNKSDQADGPGFYAVVDAVDKEGEKVVITSGAVQIMAQLFALNRLDGFPVMVCAREADKATASGYRPQWLELVTPEKPF